MQSRTLPSMADAVVSKSPPKLSAADFMFGSLLGEGAYARVVHARLKGEGGEEFAVKIMEKRQIKKEKKVRFVLMEKAVLARLSHPRVVKLHFTFQDEQHLYLAMQLCSGGELLGVIISHRTARQAAGESDVCLPLKLARFYMVELVDALCYLHGAGIVHRDLKPENVLLDAEGHLKLADFGTAKDEVASRAAAEKAVAAAEAAGGRHVSRADSFCGTAEFVSPEVLRDLPACAGSDLWALGAVLFQMLVGRPRFRGDNEFLTFQQILNYAGGAAAAGDGGVHLRGGSLSGQGGSELGSSVASRDSWDVGPLPGAGADDMHYAAAPLPASLPSAAVDLIERLLVQRPSARLGIAGGYSSLKAHEFFAGAVFDAQGGAPPPFIPPVRTLPPTEADGADKGWMYAGLNRELQATTLAISGRHSFDGLPSGGSSSSSSSSATRPLPAASAAAHLRMREVEAHLLHGERVVRCGVVRKQARNVLRLFPKVRRLVLTDRPRLFYVSNTCAEVRGEVPWSHQLKALPVSGTGSDFVVKTPTGRTYQFTDLEDEPDAAGWVAAISDVVASMDGAPAQWEAGKGAAMRDS